MSYITLQNTPITIDLMQQGNSIGWNIESGDAVHETCNSGNIELINYPITAGLSYEFSYQVKSIDSGIVIPKLGGVTLASRSSIGYYTETALAINNDNLLFYSDANCRISLVNIRITTDIYNDKSKNTIVWTEKNNKWSDFRGYVPDCGYSLFANMFTHKNGVMYRHALDNIRNRFYGQDYPSIIKFVANNIIGQPKTFQSLSYESENLLITTSDGIVTSLGQVSELSTKDNWLQDVLDDGISQVNIYDKEGVYSAGFMRDKSEDIVNGSDLKGTYITIELTTTDSKILKLRNILVNSVPSKIGSR